MDYNGNINIDKRKVIKNKDGSISTERSFGIGDGKGKEYLIPQIVDGVNLFRPAAVNHFQKTGEHLGTSPTPTTKEGWREWDNYAIKLHERQNRHYNKKPKASGLGIGELIMSVFGK